MLIYLESGSCASDTTKEEINNIAHACYQRWKYINNNLKDRGQLSSCPSYKIKFLKLSILY